ncbi:uncharacterized protein LOC129592044 [Paramacrobiotus metropolitanus]|uniref:uncharacterized protein LOC129592044 n=1 Tax=Paramacrobiotus metropolitanus TaxID=2943436 RepID=UPI00244562F1|nr:uncharacterized protein LOC129592044 [Paramacrobiotus metropolitanus]
MMDCKSPVIVCLLSLCMVLHCFGNAGTYFNLITPRYCSTKLPSSKKDSIRESYLLLRSVLKDIRNPHRAENVNYEPSASLDWGLGRSQSGSRVGTGMVALEDSQSHLSPGRKKRVLGRHRAMERSSVTTREGNNYHARLKTKLTHNLP